MAAGLEDFHHTDEVDPHKVVTEDMLRVDTYSGSFNGTQIISPVTLSCEWPTLSRLLFIVICACTGSIINGFFVAAFFVEHTLKRLGNVFHACVGLAELLITAGVMPISAVVLLSGQWDILPVCQIVQFLTEASTYCYSMFFTLVAAEIYYRLCGSPKQYEAFISMRIGLVCIIVFVVAFIMAGIGTFYSYDYDYCQRKHFGVYEFRYTTSILFYGIPFILTIYCLLASAIRIRQRSLLQLQYRRSQQYERDFSMIHLNIMAYVSYVSAWTPYLIVIYIFPATSDSKFYHCAWAGISRSLVTSFFYSILNRSFRRAFARLFYYCCCKSTLAGSFNSRHRSAVEFKITTGDVRVHIMHQAVNINTPQRGASSSRETQDL